MTYSDAYVFVKKKRSCISPNYGFISQLETYAKLVAKEKENTKD